MEKSSFFNAINDDRIYYAEDFARHLKMYFTNGVFNNDLKVIANNDMTITINSGDANIEGYRYTNIGNLIKPIATADGTLSRIDIVVTRLDLTNRTITSQVIEGAFSGTPVAPDIVRTATIFDIKLAEIYLGAGITEITDANITDTRFDNTVCGNVICAVQTPDFTEVFLQYQTIFNEFMAVLNSDKEDWEEQFNLMLTNLNHQFNNNIENKNQEFYNWFNHITEVLSSDADVQTILNHIDELVEEIENNDIFVPVEELPPVGEKNKIYLLSKPDGTFDEYIYVITSSTWELLGNVEIDLSNYYNKQSVDTLLADKSNIPPYKTFTLLTTGWGQNINTEEYEYDIIDLGISTNILVNGYMDLLNQEKLTDGYIKSYNGGFKIYTSELPTEDIEIMFTFELFKEAEGV